MCIECIERLDRRLLNVQASNVTFAHKAFANIFIGEICLAISLNLSRFKHVKQTLSPMRIKIISPLMSTICLSSTVMLTPADMNVTTNAPAVELVIEPMPPTPTTEIICSPVILRTLRLNQIFADKHVEIDKARTSQGKVTRHRKFKSGNLDSDSAIAPTFDLMI